MTARDRPGPESGSSSGKATGGDGGSNLAGSSFVAPSLWEGWFATASPAQREQLLDQARQQGLLFAHQLPTPEREKATSHLTQALTEHLRGSARQPASFAETSFEPHDRDLDEHQLQAIARALATPDLALILGYPGTGKSRVVAELARQELQRGRRALLVAADPPAIDQALARLAMEGHGEKLFRWVGVNEPLADVPPVAASLSLPGRLHHYQHHTLVTARRTAAEAKARVDHGRHQVEAWRRLQALAEESAALEQARSAVLAEIANLPSAVAAELNGTAWQSSDEVSVKDLAGIRERLTAVRAECEQVQAELENCSKQRDHLAPLVEAKESHRWWTGAWWRATVPLLATTNPRPRLEELACRCKEFDDRHQVLTREQADLEARAAEIQQRLDRERDRLLDAEVARRRGGLDARLSKLAQERQQAAAAWQSSLAKLDRPSVEPTPDALARGLADELRSLAAAEEEARGRQDWLAALEHAPSRLLATEWLAAARLVAATWTGLPAEAGESLGEFDVVILEDAHHASEADLRALADRGKRLVLVGDAEPDLPIAPPPRGRARRDGTPAVEAPSRGPLPVPPFVRLWNSLHAEPRRLPGRCRHDDGRLIVTLRSLSPEQQNWVQREQVYDRPEIELVIVAGPGMEPSVVEVSFPGNTSIADAKAFVHRELQELAIHASGLHPRWRESPTTWSLELSQSADGERTIVPIEDGVREQVDRCSCHAGSGEITWQTICLEFDKAAGWDRPRAEGWVEERLRLRDSGRTSVLSRGYRYRAGLTRFLSTTLHAGCLQPGREVAPSTPWGAGSPAVEFVPVPATPRGGGEGVSPLAQSARRVADATPRWNGSAPGTATATLTTPVRGQTRAARGGAGLEVDLSDPRRVDALPSELRPLLPARGVVNYLEARAVVQGVEDLIRDADFQAARAHWPAGANPVVAVMSLFPAQVELIRVLLKRSSVAGTSGLDVVVSQPWEMAQREALVVLLSLTRSHATRAVPFSGHPRELMVALTRAAGRLTIFGDPGTMTRRSQWFGVLDHLDQTTGPVEQALVGQLLATLPDHEPTASQPRAHAGK